MNILKTIFLLKLHKQTAKGLFKMIGLFIFKINFQKLCTFPIHCDILYIVSECKEPFTKVLIKKLL